MCSKILVSQIPFFLQADKFFIANNNMVQYVDADNFAAFSQPLRYFYVLLGWSRISGWVVMDTDNRGGRAADRFFKAG